jgi:phosphoglycerate dehydrogenase-like enzyme
MRTDERPLVLLDPHPRHNAMILAPSVRERLHAMADVVTVEHGPVPDDLVDQCLPGVTAILGQTALPRSRIERASRLRAVLNVEGNFFPNVDYAACFERGIRVACASPAFAAPVAEYALALALDLARGITAADRAFRNGEEQYGWKGNAGVRSLFGAEVGIIGFGNIGRRLASLLAPFRCRLSVFDPWLPATVVAEHGADAVELDTLLDRCRVVFVLAAPTVKNGGFIGARELSRLADGSKLVLLSRAEVVDFGALCAELRSGRVQAAIDVFPQEPVPRDHPLRGEPSAVLSAHRAGGIESALKMLGEMAVDDLELVLRGLPPVRMQPAQPETIGLQRSKPGLAGRI